jgi:DNA-binding transcriptional LysR family regulator
VDLHQIECVVAISEFRSFTKAAEHLHVTQSGLSYSVGRLETELGVSLFARLGREVVLTTSGEAFLPGAREALLASRAAREAACSVGGLLTGELALVVSSTVKRFAVDTVSEFNRLYPDVRISLSVRYPDEVLEMVRSSMAPMAIVGLQDVPKQLDSHALFDDEIVVVFPPGTEHQGAVKVEGLDQLRLVVLRQARVPKRNQHSDPSLFPHATIVAEVDDLDALVELVLAGIGAAIIPVDGTFNAAERGAVIRSLDPVKHYQVGLVHRRGRLTPVERAFHSLSEERAQRRTGALVAGVATS